MAYCHSDEVPTVRMVALKLYFPWLDPYQIGWDPLHLTAHHSARIHLNPSCNFPSNCPQILPELWPSTPRVPRLCAFCLSAMLNDCCCWLQVPVFALCFHKTKTITPDSLPHQPSSEHCRLATLRASLARLSWDQSKASVLTEQQNSSCFRLLQLAKLSWTWFRSYWVYLKQVRLNTQVIMTSQ